VNNPDAKGFTLLHKAARLGNTAAVTTLLSKGADFRATLTGRVTPLALAMRQGHVSTMNVLIYIQLLKDPNFSHLPEHSMLNEVTAPLSSYANPIAFDVLMKSRLDPNTYSTGSQRYNKAVALVKDYQNNSSSKEDIKQKLTFLLGTSLELPGHSKSNIPADDLIIRVIEESTNDEAALEMLQFLVSKGGNIPSEIKQGYGTMHTRTIAQRNNLPATAQFIHETLTPPPLKNELDGFVLIRMPKPQIVKLVPNPQFNPDLAESDSNLSHMFVDVPDTK
jgi:hypothetical protein